MEFSPKFNLANQIQKIRGHRSHLSHLLWKKNLHCFYEFTIKWCTSSGNRTTNRKKFIRSAITETLKGITASIWKIQLTQTILPQNLICTKKLHRKFTLSKTAIFIPRFLIKLGNNKYYHCDKANESTLAICYFDFNPY